MKRKLISQGKGGLTLCIPKKWADKRSLHAGNEVDIDEKGDFLLVSSTVKSKSEISINFDKDETKQVIIAVTHCYRLGFDKIEINGEKTILEIVKKTTPLLLGFDITSEKKNRIIIENLSEPSDEKFDVMLRRIFLIIKEMGNMESNISYQRNQLDRLCFFCKRTITKKINSFDNPMALWELITYLMAIGHGYYYLDEYSKKKKSKIHSGYLDSINSYFGKLYDAYYKKDTKILSQMSKMRKDIVFETPEKLIKKHDPNIIAKMQYIARITQLCTGSVYYTAAPY